MTATTQAAVRYFLVGLGIGSMVGILADRNPARKSVKSWRVEERKVPVPRGKRRRK